MSGMAPDVQRILHAIGEPTRFRILELLASRPHAVGEVATALGALQPQTTKHLQALESAGAIRVHRLGRRRVAALDHDALAHVATYLAEMATAGRDDVALQEYDAAVRQEERLHSDGDGVRTLRFERDLAAAPDVVWRAWTDPLLAARWWAPRHFSVAEFTLTRTEGSAVRVVLREGEGREYESQGRVERADADELEFSLAPVGADGLRLFEARHLLTITGQARTHLRLDIQVQDITADAASAVAGLQPGWEQLLDSLSALLEEISPAR